MKKCKSWIVKGRTRASFQLGPLLVFSCMIIGKEVRIVLIYFYSQYDQYVKNDKAKLACPSIKLHLFYPY